MPIAAKLDKRIEIPDDVNVTKQGDEIQVSGPNGESKREFPDRRISIQVGEEEVVLSTEEPSKREKSLLGTYTSHIQNMIEGGQEDYEYKLKILYSHFPVKVRSEGEDVVIENFVGEQEPRKATVLGDTEVEIEGDEITVTGPHKEEVAQTAANIESATRIKNTNERVFQDGIYIVEKAGKQIR